MSVALIEENRRRTSRTAGTAAVTVGEAFASIVDPARIDATAPVFLEFAGAVVQAGRTTAAFEGGEFYRAYRASRRIPGDVQLALDLGDDPARVATSLYVTGPVKVKEAVARGSALDAAMALAARAVTGSAFRLVANSNRESVRLTMLGDSRAIGYARVSDGNPCAFCAMLVSRGAVYKRDAVRSPAYHDRCGCTVQPVYGDDDLPPIVEMTRRFWEENAEGSGRDAINAFRRAWDSR